MISRTGSASRALALVLASARAMADEHPHGAEVIAEALFSEAKRLMTARRYDEACPKLSESQRLDPSSGTALLLALCEERRGKLASAWSTFAVALALATRDHNAEREDIARKHLDALQPRLSFLTVRVSPALAQRSVQVLLDGVSLAPPAWGVALPVDAGEHEVRAELPSLPSRVWRVRLAQEGQRETVDLSADLLASPPAPSASTTPPSAAPPSAAPPDPAPAKTTPRRSLTAPILLAGSGTAALLSAGILVLSALRDKEQLNTVCPAHDCNDPRGPALRDRALFKADAATVTAGVGGVLLGSAAWLLWSRPSSPAADLRLGPREARLGWSWTW